MARDVTDTAPLASRDELVSWFEQGNKPKERFRVGTEHEKIGFYADSLTPVPYAGRHGGDGVEALLQGLGERLGWAPIMEGDNVIGLHDEAGGGAVSLEPGGQFELSGAPLATIHETRAEMDAHMRAVTAVAEPLGIGFVGLGMSPLWSLAETPVMPKGRYRIMSDYMPKVGTRGRDMMFRTCTVQANLDFSSEADMVRKLRVSLALQPVATALFANSPFTEGRPNGFLSARSEIWRDTDNARAGMMAFAFEPGMGFERYVDYALDVPMYFIKREDGYRDVAGQSFRDLLASRLPSWPGEQATLSDWANHLSTIFPEVRLKRYLEMRGADMGSVEAVSALPALFVGLLYDDLALDGAWELVRHWTAEERQGLRDDVPRLGLRASVAGRPLTDVARDVLALARGGLSRRGHRDAAGRDESLHLAPLEDIVERRQTAAERLLEKFNRPWGGRVEPVFGECRL
jgi:glutamate--cysteine ligase